MSAFTLENGRRLLLETADILDELGIRFFLMQGTALGAYRDHGFTPTEADIDFGVLVEHLYPKQLVDALMDQDYQIETFSLPFHRIRTIVAWKYGIHVDIVGFIRWGAKRFTHSPVHPSVREPYAIVHDAGILETYQSVELFGRQFDIPSPIERYLQLEYGDDWRTPKLDHVSRTRVYDFIRKESVPHDLLGT